MIATLSALEASFRRALRRGARPEIQAALIHPICPAVKCARKHLADTGWSYRGAAAELRCSFTQLAHVLTGRRDSKSLLHRIHQLPPKPQPQP